MRTMDENAKDGLSMTGSYISADIDVDNKKDHASQKSPRKVGYDKSSETTLSESKKEQLNESKSKIESYQGGEGKGRVVHVARISQADGGWSVVDLRKRLETEVNNDQQLDENENDGFESEQKEIGQEEEKIEKSRERKQNQNGKKQQKPEDEEKASMHDIDKEDESEGFDEWAECQETVDDDTATTTLKSASGVSVESTDSSFSKAATNAFQPSLVQSCVHYFQAFFSEFVNQRIIAAKGLVLSEYKESSNRRHSEVVLEELLSKPEENDSKKMPFEKKEGERKRNGLDVRLPWEHENSLLCGEAFGAACRLLVELSCFPVYCTNEFNHHDPNQLDGKSQSSDIKKETWPV